MVVGTALGWSNLATVVLSVVLAFFFGYALTLIPLVRANIAWSTALGLAFASDTASITIMEIVDNAIMLIFPAQWVQASARRCSGEAWPCRSWLRVPPPSQ
jgi:uncharacterized membrane protein